jgi:transcriptional regulator with XRE-family HTH domain
VDMAEVLRQRRAALALSQADLAAAVGVDKRQIRRYEAGEAQPTLPVAKAMAKKLGISIDELAGGPEQRLTLAGQWWAGWQAWQDGIETHRCQPVEIKQRGNDLDIAALRRGAEPDKGGYLWRGQLRLWDNEILIGWYAADDESVRSKGALYLVIHPHGQQFHGRWTGLSFDGPIQSGWSAFARTEDAAGRLLDDLAAPEGHHD